MSRVEYRSRMPGATEPEWRPEFRIRGWDTGSVHADIFCPCGATFSKDAEQDLSQRGWVRLECPRCHRVYVVKVGCQLVLVPVGVRDD